MAQAYIASKATLGEDMALGKEMSGENDEE